MSILLRNTAVLAALCLDIASIGSRLEAQEPIEKAAQSDAPQVATPIDDPNLVARKLLAREELEKLSKRLTKLEQIAENPNDPAVVRAKRRVVEAQEALDNLQQGNDKANPQPVSGEARILKKLDQVDSPQLINQPLNDVLQYLEKHADLKINLDAKALEAAGISSKTIVNLRGRDLRIETALLLVLEPLGLSYRIDGEGLIVTSPNSTSRASKSRDRGKDDLEKLRELAEKQLQGIERQINEREPWRQWWIDSTRRWIQEIQDAIAHPDDGYRPEAAELLLEMVVLWADPRDISDIAGKSLEEVLEIVRKNSGLEISVDWDLLKTSGIPSKTLINTSPGTLRLGQGLDVMLRPLGLAAQVDGIRLIIKPTPTRLIADTLIDVGNDLKEWRAKLQDAAKISNDPNNPRIAEEIETSRLKAEEIEALARRIDRIVHDLRYTSADQKMDPAPRDNSTAANPLRDPEVKVSEVRVLTTVGDEGKKYSLAGEVTKPGDYLLEANETVLDAIIRAGGIVSPDLKVKISLIRLASQGSLLAQSLPVDLEAIVQKGDKTTNHSLQPGDRLVVTRAPIDSSSDQEQRLKEIERKLERLLEERKPLKNK